MTDVIASARDRRAQIQAYAASIGIDDAYISTLVDTFYGRIRAHPELGPIFEGEVGDKVGRAPCAHEGVLGFGCAERRRLFG